MCSSLPNLKIPDISWHLFLWHLQWILSQIWPSSNYWTKNSSSLKLDVAPRSGIEFTPTALRVTGIDSYQKPHFDLQSSNEVVQRHRKMMTGHQSVLFFFSWSSADASCWAISFSQAPHLTVRAPQPCLLLKESQSAVGAMKSAVWRFL